MERVREKHNTILCVAAVFIAALLLVSVVGVTTGSLLSVDRSDEQVEEELNDDIADWTILNWIMGNNDLRHRGVQDLEEMANSGSDDNINMMAFFDWGDITGSPPYPTGLYHVKPGNPDLIVPYHRPISTDPGKIIWALEYILEHYPANHYQLIMWDHGDGVRTTGDDWNWGVINVGEYAKLYQDQLEYVLRTIYERTGTRMDIVMYDTCLNARIEAAYSISKYADYMVASEELEPGNSRNYATTLNALKANPTMSPRDLASLWVDHATPCPTQSAMDLSMMIEINRDWQDLSRELLKALPTHHTTIRNARANSVAWRPTYDVGEVPTNVAIKSFLDQLVARSIPQSLEDQANIIRDKWDDFVVNSKGGSGMTVWYPPTNWPSYSSAHAYSRYAGALGYYRNGEKAMRFNEESYPYFNPQLWSDQDGDLSAYGIDATTPFNKYWHAFLYADWAMDAGSGTDVSVLLPDGEGFNDYVDTVWCPEFTEIGVPAPFMALVRNMGGSNAETTVTLSINGSPVKSEVIELLPGEMREVRIWYAIETLGQHDITIAATTPGDTNPGNNQGSHRTITTDKNVLVIGNDVDTYGSNPSNPGSAHLAYLSALDDASIDYEFWCYVENQGHTWWDRLNRGGIVNEISLKPFDTVIYVTGGVLKNNHYTMAHWDLETINKYLKNEGGGLILADPYYESRSRITFQDYYEFYKMPFGMEYQGNDVGSSIVGVDGDPIGDGLSFSISTSSPSQVEQWAPSHKASYSEVFLTDTSDRGAGVRADTGTYRTVYMGFCISEVSGSANRASLLSNAVDWVSSGDRLNHYICGYTENYGEFIVVTNTATGENLYATTDEFGFYRVNLANLPSGYNHGNLISVAGDEPVGEVYVDTSLVEQIVPTTPPGIPPEITILSPDGGETWTAGTTENILWTTTRTDDDIDNIDLEYSPDGGVNWNPIVSGIPDTGSYPWSVPGVLSDECLVRGTVRDVVGRTGQDVSDGVFEITGTPPSIDLIAPNGGEVWNAGETEWITWTTQEGAVDITDIDIEYSTNGGTDWEYIVQGIPDSGSYQWLLPNEPSESSLVRVTVHDELGFTSSDTSDAYFTIVGIPPLPAANLAVDHFGEDETAVLFEEDFSGVPEGTIPTGWTRSHTHWGVVNTNEAGGTSPELRYLGSGSTTATYRCYTPAIDTSGYTEVDFSFRHRYYHLIGSITLRVEVSTDGSSWSTLWQHTSGSTGPAVIDMTLDTTDGVGSSSLYLAWTFVGRSNDARRWVIDDISLSIEVESEGNEHNLITWDASPDDPDGITHYNLYRAESYDGPWVTPITVVDATGQADYQYIDINRGAADETLWWYLVRAVGNNGMEDGSTDAVREPGPTETFDITLTEGGAADGWNFVSFNLIPDSASLEAILSDIDGSYDRVMYYDASTGRWRSYMPGRAERFNNLNSWNHHMGIWIKVHSGATLTVEGSLPTTTDISLHPGWNMVGLPSETSGNHGIPAEVDVVGYFDASASGNLAYSHTPGTFVFEPGKAYWVHNPTASTVTWTVDY